VRKKYILPFVALFIVACGNEDYSKNKEVNDLIESQLIEKLKTPLRETIVLVHNNSTFLEYQSDLSDLKKDLNDGDTIQVKEMYWEHEKSNQVVWLISSQGVWKVFDNLSWSKEIQF